MDKPSGPSRSDNKEFHGIPITCISCTAFAPVEMPGAIFLERCYILETMNGSQLLNVHLDVLTIFVIGDIDNLTGHARPDGFHNVRHVHALDLRGEMSADLHAGID